MKTRVFKTILVFLLIVGLVPTINIDDSAIILDIGITYESYGFHEIRGNPNKTYWSITEEIGWVQDDGGYCLSTLTSSYVTTSCPLGLEPCKLGTEIESIINTRPDCYELDFIAP